MKPPLKTVSLFLEDLKSLSNPKQTKKKKKDYFQELFPVAFNV